MSRRRWFAAVVAAVLLAAAAHAFMDGRAADRRQVQAVTIMRDNGFTSYDNIKRTYLTLTPASWERVVLRVHDGATLERQSGPVSAEDFSRLAKAVHSDFFHLPEKVDTSVLDGYWVEVTVTTPETLHRSGGAVADRYCAPIKAICDAAEGIAAKEDAP